MGRKHLDTTQTS